MSNSYTGRKKFILKSTAKRVAEQLSQVRTDKSVNALSVISGKCGTNITDSCFTCLNMKFPGPNLNDINYVKKNIDAINDLRRGDCSQACVCKFNNIDINTNLQVNLLSGVTSSQIDADKLTKDIMSDLKNEYGSSSINSVTNQNVTNYVVAVKTNINQTIEQTISILQGLGARGIGYTFENITMNTVVDALMQAIIKSTANVTDAPSVDDIVSQQMSYIRTQVDKEVTSGFQQAWEQLKTWVFVFGGFTLFLIIIIIVMLMWRALKK